MLQSTKLGACNDPVCPHCQCSLGNVKLLDTINIYRCVNCKAEFAGPVILESIQNLVLNLGAGLLPEYLTKDEIELLKIKFGSNWFTKLGYSEPQYKNPER